MTGEYFHARENKSFVKHSAQPQCASCCQEYREDGII